MKKQTNFSTKGNVTNVGSLSVNRMLPNQYVNKVGPFVFLDYVAPFIKKMISKSGMGAHPHRGIATLTYVIQGEEEHYDSLGNYAKIHSGGVQWMKAGTGILHDGNLNYDTETDSKFVEGFQFWINLPSQNKAEKPAHLAIQANDVPQKKLADESGWIKVIVGSYEELSSQIPNYSEQFLYHIHLEAGKQFSIKLNDKMESAAFLPTAKVTLNDTEFEAGEFVEFSRNEGLIEIKNTDRSAIDILLFGGEEYIEPVVSEGPFVMNSEDEIILAYQDFYEGKYGKMNLSAKI
ncbi:pirin family protein [Chryseobacterium sp. FH1]|uniref:pirin family protein n=1 Tax=Chryseobacterium sp. FH1 TaxID=1233951 RepID=UPI0004E406A2|nr:pirin family protein [Chryseobacterium sp. FH1]KFC19521.1 Pirin-like protein [Chryseobacterium sp. FH1]